MIACLGILKGRNECNHSPSFVFFFFKAFIFPSLLLISFEDSSSSASLFRFFFFLTISPFSSPSSVFRLFPFGNCSFGGIKSFILSDSRSLFFAILAVSLPSFSLAFFSHPFKKYSPALHLQIYFSRGLRRREERFILFVVDDMRFSTFGEGLFGEFGEESVPRLIRQFWIFGKFSFYHEFLASLENI